MAVEVKTVEIRDAKKEFQRWLALAQQGVEVIVTDEGEPLARISAVRPNEGRVAGLNRGEIKAAEDFDELLPESYWVEETTMSDLQGYIKGRKANDPEFAEGFEEGYEAFKSIYRAYRKGHA